MKTKLLWFLLNILNSNTFAETITDENTLDSEDVKKIISDTIDDEENDNDLKYEELGKKEINENNFFLNNKKTINNSVLSDYRVLYCDFVLELIENYKQGTNNIQDIKNSMRILGKNNIDMFFLFLFYLLDVSSEEELLINKSTNTIEIKNILKILFHQGQVFILISNQEKEEEFTITIIEEEKQLLSIFIDFLVLLEKTENITKYKTEELKDFFNNLNLDNYVEKNNIILSSPITISANSVQLIGKKSKKHKKPYEKSKKSVVTNDKKSNNTKNQKKSNNTKNQKKTIKSNVQKKRTQNKHKTSKHNLK